MTAIQLEILAQRVHGELFARVADAVVTGAAPLSDALPGHITLLDHERYLPKLQESRASAVVTPQSFPEVQLPQIVVSDPHGAFAKICALFRPSAILSQRFGIDAMAAVAATARVSPNSFVDAFVSVAADCEVGGGTHLHRGVTVMQGCSIGKDCQLFPGVVLYPGTVLEDRVVLHAGVVLGAHGFGYRMESGAHQPTSQLGWVHIESDVEIGANTTVDRGTYGATRIGQGTKIDNLVMIAHNCNIGRHNLICAHVGIAGSTSTGDYVVLAGQAGLRDHIHIGHRSMVGAQSGVSNDVGDDMIMLGSPAVPRTEQAILFAAINRLPEMRKSLKRLERRVDQIVSMPPLAPSKES